MRLALRGGGDAPKRLVMIAEGEAESKLLDEIFGDKADSDGLIGIRHAECRLSDGYAEHYVLIK